MLINDTRRLAGIAGLAFIVIVVVTFILPGAPPAIDDPDSRILDFFADKRSRILWTGWLSFLAILPAVFFFGAFVTTLRQSEGDQPIRATATLIAFTIVGAFAVLIAALFAVGAFEAGHGLDDKTARLYYDLLAVSTNGQFIPLGAFGLFSGWCIVAKGAFPAWCGWLGILAGVLAVLDSAFLASDGAFALASPLGVIPGFAGFLLYTLALSVLMLRPAKTN